MRRLCRRRCESARRQAKAAAGPRSLVARVIGTVAVQRAREAPSMPADQLRSVKQRAQRVQVNKPRIELGGAMCVSL